MVERESEKKTEKELAEKRKQREYITKVIIHWTSLAYAYACACKCVSDDNLSVTVNKT